jgi:L-lactate permease
MMGLILVVLLLATPFAMLGYFKSWRVTLVILGALLILGSSRVLTGTPQPTESDQQMADIFTMLVGFVTVAGLGAFALGWAARHVRSRLNPMAGTSAGDTFE